MTLSTRNATEAKRMHAVMMSVVVFYSPAMAGHATVIFAWLSLAQTAATALCNRMGGIVKRGLSVVCP